MQNGDSVEENTKSGVCPICTQKTLPFFSVSCDYRKPDKRQSYCVEWCENCNYGHVWERPLKDDIASFYELDNYYTHKTSGDGTKLEKGSFLDRIRTHIAWHFDKGEELMPLDIMPLLNNDALTLCEIGCGNGENLVKFLDKGFSVVGVEPDPVARQTAKKTGMNVFEGTAEELPSAVLTNKYDVVLMSHVLEHCLDINAAVLNAKAILKKGGVFIVETPNCDSHGFKDYLGESPWADIPRHLNFFTRSSLESILAKQGFSVVAIKYRGFCRQFSNSWLESEQEIRQVFASCSPGITSQPNYKLRAWALLLKCLFSSQALKYDSVRLVAING